MTNTRILVVDDEATLRHALVEALGRKGFSVHQADNADTALDLAREIDFDIVLSDIRLPGRTSGLDLLRQITETTPDTFFIMMTAYATVETAIEALRLGAYDYIVKPAMLQEITNKVSHLAQYRELRAENRRLRSQMHRIGQNPDIENIVGSSPQMKMVFDLVRKVTSTPSTVLIIGESGTGKEVIARAIHNTGARAEKPFVPIDCASIPDNLLESELFGHRKGSFTGADRDKDGLFIVAADGTLFLDEIGEVPLHLQVKLLRTIEEKNVMPIGGTSRIPFSARIVAATSRDLEAEVEHGRFRPDLYYRLNVVQIDLPPLRKRVEDIPAFVSHFVNKLNTELRTNFTGSDTAAMRALMNYSWKGNVRELENVVERAMIISEGSTITMDDLPKNVVGEAVAITEEDSDELTTAVKAFEEKHIRKVIDKVGCDSRKACEALNISRSTFFDKLRTFGLSLRAVRKHRAQQVSSSK